jgi:hypothetical protein
VPLRAPDRYLRVRHSVSMYRARELALLAALAACASCGRSGHTSAPSVTTSRPLAGSQAADAACNGPGRQAVGSGAVLRAAFQSTALAIARWQQTGSTNPGTGPRPPRREPPFPAVNGTDQTAFVCYFDGEFPASAPPPGPGQTVPPEYNRARVFIDSSGTAVVDAYGRTSGYGSIPIDPPPPK